MKIIAWRELWCLIQWWPFYSHMPLAKQYRDEKGGGMVCELSCRCGKRVVDRVVFPPLRRPA